MQQRPENRSSIPLRRDRRARQRGTPIIIGVPEKPSTGWNPAGVKSGAAAPSPSIRSHGRDWAQARTIRLTIK
ncbi:hypothetical protein [Ralstonia syzygii]|uniref:hypothetical protein n=1 Tax=Ralstonia syzygii TaxID=28097 RepID=UPI0018D18A76|nr:hypothetical protein [Ralstonia syzygii]